MLHATYTTYLQHWQQRSLAYKCDWSGNKGAQSANNRRWNERKLNADTKFEAAGEGIVCGKRASCEIYIYIHIYSRGNNISELWNTFGRWQHSFSGAPAAYFYRCCRCCCAICGRQLPTLCRGERGQHKYGQAVQCCSTLELHVTCHLRSTSALALTLPVSHLTFCAFYIIFFSSIFFPQ